MPFKGALLAAGYRPRDPFELNWFFNARPQNRRDPAESDYASRLGYALEPHEPRELRLILWKRIKDD